MRSALSALGGLAQSARGESSTDELLDRERTHNKLLRALREDATLRDILLGALREGDPSVALYVLLPQSSTLDDVAVTAELVETHVVFLDRAVPRGKPRAFTSLNGVCGVCAPDGAITVHGRLQRAAASDVALGSSVAGWAQALPNGRNVARCAPVPPLESQIFVLRESQLSASAKLPLASPVGLLLTSDPLFFPGCGWKLSLALKRCGRTFEHTELHELPLADISTLLDEYQIMARAWRDGATLVCEPKSSRQALPEDTEDRVSANGDQVAIDGARSTAATVSTAGTVADGGVAANAAAQAAAKASFAPRSRLAALSKAAEVCALSYEPHDPHCLHGPRCPMLSCPDTRPAYPTLCVPRLRSLPVSQALLTEPVVTREPSASAKGLLRILLESPSTPQAAASLNLTSPTDTQSGRQRTTNGPETAESATGGLPAAPPPQQQQEQPPSRPSAGSAT